MQKYFEKDFVTIGYDKDIHAVILKWQLAPTSTEFREGVSMLIPAMQHFKTGKLITDTTYLGTIYPHDQEWASSDWLRSALQVGYSHIAIILPSDIFTQMSVEDTMNQVVIDTVGTQYFSSIESAKEWIKNF